MKIRMALQSNLFILGLLCAVQLSGQTTLPLYSGITPDASGDPPNGVTSVSFIDGSIDFEGLQSAPDQVRLFIPGAEIVVDLVEFDPIEGFDEFGDPLPISTIEDMIYSWSGKSSNSDDVILGVAEGFISGLINGPSGQFLINRSLGVDALLELAPDDSPDEPPLETSPVAGFEQTTGSLTAETPARVRPLVAVRDSDRRADMSIMPVAAPAPSKMAELNFLVAYTEQAVMDAAAANPFSLAPMQTLIVGANADLNATFRNSNINARSTVVHHEMIEFDPADFQAVDPRDTSRDIRDALKGHMGILNLRDQFEADIVVVILQNENVTNSPVPICGFAHTQRPGCGDNGPIGDCDMGPRFAPYALVWVAQDCVRGVKHSFVHEVGHALDAEHDEDLGIMPRARASYPTAYGKRVPEGGFKTAMAGGPERRELVFANPDVILFGFPTGDVGDSENAWAISRLIQYVEGFRGPSDLISSDGWERGDLHVSEILGVVVGATAAQP